ncbi:hypothetical protein ABBQ32_003006 [Trebouxia sp. C0010 RCD-2024]
MQVRLGHLDRSQTNRDTTGDMPNMAETMFASEDMEPAKLQQQILSSNRTASEKAEDFLLEREVNEMNKDEWRELIAGIPEDVKREIGRLKSAGLGSQDVRSFTQGGGDADLLGMEEIRMLAAFAKQHMTKSHSVRLSDLDPSQWGCIRKNAGLRLKPYTGEISGLELQPVTPFQWSEAPEASQASQYLPHIGSHIQQTLHDKKYCMYDARRYRTLLTVSGMQAELGPSEAPLMQH